MSQPFRWTAPLRPASLCVQDNHTHIPTSTCIALMAEGQGRAELPALASHSVNGGGC